MKKGQEQAVIKLILLLAFAGFLIVLVAKLNLIIAAEGDVQICRVSMQKAETFRGLVNVWTTLDCPYTPITLEQKDVSRFKAKEKIAEQLSDCWYKTLGTQGHKVWDKRGDNWNFCMVCGQFTLIGDELRIPAEEMGQFLDEGMTKEGRPWINTMITDWKMEGNRQFFLDLDKVGGQVRLNELEFLEPETDYLVMYIYIDNNHVDELFPGGIPHSKYRDVTRKPFLVPLTGREYLEGEDHHHTFIIPAQDAGDLPTCEMFYDQLK